MPKQQHLFKLRITEPITILLQKPEEQIFLALEESNVPLTVHEVVKRTNLPLHVVRHLLSLMKRMGLLANPRWGEWECIRKRK